MASTGALKLITRNTKEDYMDRPSSYDRPAPPIGAYTGLSKTPGLPRSGVTVVSESVIAPWPGPAKCKHSKASGLYPFF